jgi:hypothetical protein
MNISINWIIERLLVKPTEGTLTDVVITADWRCNGTQDNYSGTCYGSSSFAPPTGSFTPYDQLTQDQVLGWCFANGVDQAAIEANVTQQIQNQIDPPVVVLPLPWVPPVPPAPVVVLPLPWVPPAPDPVPPMLPYIAPVLVANDAPVADASAA